MTVLDRFLLDSKVAIVTGASSGLGAGFAVALAEVGADVVLAARRADRLVAVAVDVEACGRRVLTHTTDVTDPEQCTAWSKRPSMRSVAWTSWSTTLVSRRQLLRPARIPTSSDASSTST